MTRIRRALAGDLEALVGLAAEYCEADGHVFDESTVRAGFGPLLVDDRHGVVLVAEANDAEGEADADHAGSPDGRGASGASTVSERGLLGYGVLTWSWSIEIGGPEAVLDELYVRTRNQGIGGRLVDALVAAGREHGMRRIFLETERPNEAARRLYERHGFETDDSIWMARVLDGGRNGP
jgi:GNAT superfamily N-acetyltransferase